MEISELIPEILFLPADIGRRLKEEGLMAALIGALVAFGLLAVSIAISNGALVFLTVYINLAYLLGVWPDM